MVATAKSSPFAFSAWAFRAWLTAIRYLVPPPPPPPLSPPPSVCSTCCCPRARLRLGFAGLHPEMVPVPLRLLRPLL